ncbi:hypothetical protein DIBBI_gp74 [Xanthomonas phage vB_XveM_DIBBI]|uniref:Uncharacterized protein n=1 Tax=Xanthomonas phage vB_XveM_DIBBI TaxID=1129194 RepID=I3PH07_9CAUD|nr:hypothetical protein DIBBI_gp74 [Xanthomonas phage vB_XveM_DIBBI]AEX65742.1 hypothetical protein DIBBI_074 [Xanthomonas phage vB_XveM_DIBBI]
MFTLNVKVTKMSKFKVISAAVFKHFDGFRVRGVNRHTDFLLQQAVEVHLERNGVMVTIAGPAIEVDQLISLQPAKYWDGGHDPVIGQEFRSKSSDKAYTVEFPAYRDGVLVGCYSAASGSTGSFFVCISDMMPGREPLTAAQQRAVEGVMGMFKTGIITLEQSDEMIAIIKKSTKS